MNHSGLSRAAIFNAVEASLKRLDTPYIDLLQIHRADLGNVEAEETMKALHDLVQSGKVRYIGASSMWAWQLQHYNHVAEVRLPVLDLYKIKRIYFTLLMMQKHGWTRFISMQGQYSLTYVLLLLQVKSIFRADVLSFQGIGKKSAR